jgi:hydrophobe/amphiphile efflux-3 (HAE3) family protein
MLKRYAELIILIKWPLFLSLLILTLFFAFKVTSLQIDPTVESLFSKNSDDYQYYIKYKQRYGSDHVVAVAMSTPELFTHPHLKMLVQLTHAISAFPEVERILSLSTVMDIKHKFMGVKIVPALEGVAKGERSLKELKKEILGNELFVNNLISPDGRTANIVIRLREEKTEGESGSFIKNLRQLLKTFESRQIKFYVAGSPVEQYDFVRLIRKDQFTFVPMIALLFILMTFVIYRNLTCVALAMSMVGAALLWTFGVIAILGKELNLVTSLLAPVIMIVTVVNAIHFMNLFFELRPHHASIRKCVVLTMQQLGIPCFLTHFTTVIGFLSLAINPIPAIRSFGLFAAMGTVFSYIISMVLVPMILPLLPYRYSSRTPHEGNFFNRVLIGFIEMLEFRWKWWILVLVFVSIILSLVGIKRLNVDTSLVKQMKPDSPLAVATNFIDDNITGVYSIGYILRRKDEGTVIDYELLQKVDDFKIFLESLEPISKVNSITTVLKRINLARTEEAQDYSLPEKTNMLQRFFDGMVENEDPEIWFLISKDFKEIRLEARMKSVGTKEGALVEAQAEAYIKDHLSPYFDTQITGNVVLLGRMAKELVFYQMKSFAFAFVPILLLIIIIFKSIRMGIIAAIPNLLPILIVYGIMGFLNIELSTATAMISSIVLGLVVDSSIHFLHRFREEFRHRGNYLQALHHTYRNVGQALCVSTAILVIGFSTSIFAGFRPTVQFGLLTGLTIFIALICTLLALPVWLILLKPFGPPPAFKKDEYV